MDKSTTDFICPGCKWKIRAYSLRQAATVTCGNCSREWKTQVTSSGPEITSEEIIRG